MPKIHHRVPAELKQLWLDALASGKYTKGNHCYKYDDGVETYYCALGVLLEVARVTEQQYAQANFWERVEAFPLGEERVGFWFEISILNDASPNFQPVIEFIKENM